MTATDTGITLAAQPDDVQAWYVAKYGVGQAEMAFQRDRSAGSSVRTVSPAGAPTIPGVPTGALGYSGVGVSSSFGGAPASPPPSPDGTPSLSSAGASLQHKSAQLPFIKGEPVTIMDGAQGSAISDYAVDMRAFNAMHVDVIVTGTTPSGTVAVLGSPNFGGIFILLGSAAATQAAVIANKSFDVLCGASFAKIQLSSVTGAYLAGQGFRVIVTPFLAPSLGL